MALSLSGPGTPPLCWEGGSRGRGPFQNSTFLPGLVGIQGVGRLFHGELEIFPSPQPLAAFKTPPPPAEAIPAHPSSSPWLSEKESQKIS